MRNSLLVSIVLLAASCGGVRNLSGDYDATATRTASSACASPPAAPTGVTVHVVRNADTLEHTFTFTSGTATCTLTETNCGDFSCLDASPCIGVLTPAGWTRDGTASLSDFLGASGGTVTFDAHWRDAAMAGCTIAEHWTLTKH